MNWHSTHTMQQRFLPRWRIPGLSRVVPVLLALGLGHDVCAWESGSNVRVLIEEFCLDCHDTGSAKADLDLENLLGVDLLENKLSWERVIQRLATGQMPPHDKPQPDPHSLNQALVQLESALDRDYFLHSAPGRADTFRRINRFEYQNSIRDLLALELDTGTLLPHEESSHGFDNVSVANLSPSLLERYIAAAQKIARQAIGDVSHGPIGEIVRLKPDVTQEKHVEGLPLGTRGGTSIRFNFPASGQYQIRVHLARDRNEHVEGLHQKHQMDILLDRSPVGTFEIAPPPDRQDFTHVDDHLNLTAAIDAGPHEIGITFPARSFSLAETRRQPFDAHFNMHRHPRLTPAVYQVSITGPIGPSHLASTPSREKIFSEWPESPGEYHNAARRILKRLASQAWRRPLNASDIERLMVFFDEALHESASFEKGIENALSAVLISPEFLFRIESQPEGLRSGEVYLLSSLEIATRLSFFLWSSLPDEDLIHAALAGDLQTRHGRHKHVLRMLADPRSQSIVTQFGGQWLYLRNLESITPDSRLFPDFDDNLRQAFRQETELFLRDILEKDRSVLNLLKADYTFLNERLAHHYDIPHVYGTRFRRVSLDAEHRRGGLLRQGSILTVTSYATRTSPVLRGNWILKNIIGTPPPPPPPDIPSLDNTPISESLPIRVRLDRHREDASCASCHNLMDPIGFALENYDAVGRWRSHVDGEMVDATGGLPDGFIFEGVPGLEDGLLKRPENFVYTLTSKLLTYALGRGVDEHDGPAIRRIVDQASRQDYRFSAIIQGIVESIPFQMRTAL